MIESSKLKFHIGEVLPYDYTYRYVDASQPDTNVNTLFAIAIRTYTDYYNNQPLLALPANANIKQIPLVGEHVLIFRSTNQQSNSNETADTKGWGEAWYYLPVVGLKTAINENRLPGLAEGLSDIDIEKRVPGKTFQPKSISPLQPYEGDLLIEGRWGNSIRFSSTISTNVDYTIDRPWRGDESGDPILIISNGQRNLPNKQFVVENIQEDPASIYLTSRQHIPSFKLNNALYQGISESEFDYPQIIATADRITLRAKSDHVILDSQKGIEINSPKIYLGTSTDKEPLLHTEAVVELLQKIIDTIQIGFVDAGGKISTPVYNNLQDAGLLLKQIKNYNVMVDKYKN
jgi:hypothetical protein